MVLREDSGKKALNADTQSTEAQDNTQSEEYVPGCNVDGEYIYGTEIEKPECRLVGTDGNVFALAGKAANSLKGIQQYDKAKEMINRIFKSGSYDEALLIITDYVDAQ